MVHRVYVMSYVNFVEHYLIRPRTIQLRKVANYDTCCVSHTHKPYYKQQPM